MPNDTVTPATSPDDKIEFVEFHRPPLEAGEYRLELTHVFKIDEHSGTPSATIRKTFYVRGPRYSISPELIHSRFPPPGSRGYDWHVFPHIVLERSTLPWERSAFADAPQGIEPPPWLALLLFTQEEAKTIEKATCKLSKFYSETWPSEPFETGNENVASIKVSRAILDPLLPKGERDFTLRTHARLTTSIGGVSVERAVVMCNRLPMHGERSEVHLVSLEGHYDNQFEFNFGSGDVTLISLASWSFFCLDETKSFTTLAKGLNVSRFCLPAGDVIDKSKAGASEAGKRITTGFIPLSHRFREGSRSVSWYHGPMAARVVPKPDAIALPARTADALLLFDVSTGMFDVSYAAAWELGRMMMLARTGTATRLYNWKRQHAQSLSSMRHLVDMGFDIPRLKGNGASSQGLRDGRLDEQVAAFFESLSILRGVPFSCLAPDERMLPSESLRLFDIDKTWLECLRDGAFSIGRVQQRDLEQDHAHIQKHFAFVPRMSGVLIRSALVSGYPGLNIEAYENPATGAETKTQSPLGSQYGRLTCLRMERLSRNVLLCIFAGEIRMLDIHMHPELLHFGLDVPAGVTENEPEKLVKMLRTGTGSRTDKAVAISITNRIVDLVSLAQNIKTGLDALREADRPSSHKPADPSLNPAVFAYEMTAGVDLVRFIINKE